MFLKITFRSVIRYKDPLCIMQCRNGSSRIMIDNNFIEISWGQHISTRPVSGVGANSWGGIGQTLVDALDTLWLMDFKEDFQATSEVISGQNSER